MKPTPAADALTELIRRSRNPEPLLVLLDHTVVRLRAGLPKAPTATTTDEKDPK